MSNEGNVIILESRRESALLREEIAAAEAELQRLRLFFSLTPDEREEFQLACSDDARQSIQQLVRATARLYELL